MDRKKLLTAVEREGQALLTAAGSDPSAQVEHCPNWDAQALIDHLGNVWSFMATQIEAANPERPTRPDEDGAPAAQHLARLVQLLSTTDPSTPCWNWCPDDTRNVGWVLRRMAHENAVHRWDAENAKGEATGIETELARDGVDEILDVAWRYQNKGPVTGYPTETLHLHQTDGDGEWLLSAINDQLVVSREHAKGDAAVRGTASDLVLLVWGRRQPDVEVFGEETVVDAWLDLAP